MTSSDKKLPLYLSSTHSRLGGKDRNLILLAKGKSFLLQKDFVPIHPLLLEIFSVRIRACHDDVSKRA